MAPAERCHSPRLAAALIVLLGSTQTRAQAPDPLELTWNAPSFCPSGESIQERVRNILGGVETSGTPVRADATVSRQGKGRLRLKLVVRSGTSASERIFHGGSCEDLAGAAAVSLALVVRAAEPLGAAERLVGAPEARDSSSSAEPRPALENSERISAAHVGSESNSKRLVAPNPGGHVGPRRGILQAPLVTLGVGPFPNPSVGTALAAGLRLQRWYFLGEANAWLQQELKARNVAAGARVDRLELGLRTCYAFPLAPFELAPCMKASVVHIWARGTGAYVEAETAESTWIAASAGAQVRLALAQWLTLVATADAQLGMARPRLSVDGLGAVGELAPAAVLINLGSEWNF